MNIVFITQDEPFYLKNTFELIIRNLPKNAQITGVVLLSPSPFGKKLTYFEKYKNTLQIFGFKFSIYYFFKLISSKLRKGSVRSVLIKNNIPIIQLDSSINSISSLENIKNFKPDLLISVAGNEIFKKDLINLAPLGCLNLHTALLPKYRGLMPTFWVLKNQEVETGVSVFYVDEGIDSGEILIQERVQIQNMTQEELITKTKHLGAFCIISAIEAILDNNVKIIPNNDENMTYFGFPTRSDVKEFLKVGAKFF